MPSRNVAIIVAAVVYGVLTDILKMSVCRWTSERKAQTLCYSLYVLYEKLRLPEMFM